MKIRISRKVLYDKISFSEQEEVSGNLEYTKFNDEQIKNTVVLLDCLYKKYCNNLDTELSCPKQHLKEDK